MAAIRRAEVTWSGDLATGTGTVSAIVQRRFDSPAGVLGRADRGARRQDQPEELLAAAHASCFAMAFSGRLGRAGHPPERLDVSADVTFDKVEAGWRVVSSALTVRGVVPGMSAEDFDAAAEAAKDGCPISQALMGNVALSVEADARASLGDRQQPPRVRHGHRLDLGVADARRAQARQERLARGTCSRCPRSGSAASRGRRPGSAGSARRGRAPAARRAARRCGPRRVARPA